MTATTTPARAETATATACRQPLAFAAHSPLMVLTLRAWARSTLWQAGDLDLHEAVDTLQAAAVSDGLVAKLGQDRVQEIMAAAFAAVRDDLLKFEDIEAEPTFADEASSAPGWRDAAVAHHKDRGARVSVTSYTADDFAKLRELMADNVTLDSAWHEINHPTERAAASAVEALMFALRRGLGAIEHPDNQQRLSKLNDEQMREVAPRLQKFMPHVAPAWTSADVEALVSLWSKLRC